MSQLKSGIYKHYSGLLVMVLGVARHSETEERLVAYVPLGVKAGPRITVRPYEMFFGDVAIAGKLQPRFVHLGEDVPAEIAQEYLPSSRKTE